MAKRIEFLAPVEAMRGNLSGSQELQYPNENRTAWDAPSDKRSYATNYGTRYIGAKRSSDGLKYFAVKQRQAVNMSPAMRKQMAVLAVSSVVANNIRLDLTNEPAVTEYYHASGYQEQGWTMKRWLMSFIRTGLIGKTHFFINAPGKPSIVYENPYITTVIEGSFPVPQFPTSLLVKFWEQLATNPITFTVDGLKGVAHSNDIFAAVVESGYNVLGLANKGTAGVLLNGRFITDPAGAYIEPRTDVIANAQYITTDGEPTN